MYDLDQHQFAVEAASRIISSYVRRTPLEAATGLDSSGNVMMKLENYQLTGSFKLRGAANAISKLYANKANPEFITASTGNHGFACAYVAGKIGVKSRIILPTTTSKIKINALGKLGAFIQQIGDDCVRAELAAKRIAEAESLPYISPYNHLDVIAGQGTIAQEILEELPKVDYVLVPVGGGGLISGIAGYIKKLSPSTKVIGCQPSNSAVMYHSIKKKRLVGMESLPTISDGTSGGIEKDSITFDICKENVDDFILVDEAEIQDAIYYYIESHNMLVEGAGALTLAAYKKHAADLEGAKTVLIVSGGRMGLETLRKIFLTQE